MNAYYILFMVSLKCINIWMTPTGSPYAVQKDPKFPKKWLNIWNCKLSWIHFSLVCFMNDLACQYNPYSLILHGWLPGTGMSKSSKDLLTPEQSSVGEHLGDPPGWSLIIYQGKKVGHTISLTVMFCINYKWPSNRLSIDLENKIIKSAYFSTLLNSIAKE